LFGELRGLDENLVFSVVHSAIRALLHGRVQTFGVDVATAELLEKTIHEIESTEATALAELNNKQRSKYVGALVDIALCRTEVHTVPPQRDFVDSLALILPPG
jgi:hypothetical protein